MTHLTHANSAGGNTKAKPSPASFLKKRSRSWFLTINNYDSSHIKILKNLKTSRLTFQSEKGHETGTPHLQVYIMFVNQRSGRSMKNTFPTAHIEAVRSDRLSQKYCLKDDTWTGEHRFDRLKDNIITDISNGLVLPIGNGGHTVDLSRCPCGRFSIRELIDTFIPDYELLIGEFPASTELRIKLCIQHELSEMIGKHFDDHMKKYDL